MMDKQAVFNNLTAWFARSVSSRRKALWVKHGGRIVDVPDAQFIFSQDVEDWDTKSLFKTEDYLIGCLTVFHAGFIDACLKNQSAHKTLASKYLLLPKDAPKVLHSVVIPLDQMQEDNPRRLGMSSVTAEEGGSRDRLAPATTSQDVNSREPVPQGGYDSTDIGSGGDRLADAPTGSRMADGSEARQETAVEEEQRGTEGAAGDGLLDSRDCPASGRVSGGLQGSTGAPDSQNLDISRIPHVKDLPKVSGPIVDFALGKNGFSVQKIEDT